MGDEGQEDGKEKGCCDVCGKAGAGLRCSGCHVARYCSRECQRRDWARGHRQRCAVAEYPDVAAATEVSSDAEHRLLAARAFAAGELMYAEVPVLAAPLEPQRRLRDGAAKATRDEEARSAEARYEGALLRGLLAARSENVIPLEHMGFVPPDTVTTWSLVNLLACYLAAAEKALNKKDKKDQKDKDKDKEDKEDKEKEEDEGEGEEECECAMMGPVCAAVDALPLPAESSVAASSRSAVLRGLAADVAALAPVRAVLARGLAAGDTVAARAARLLTRLDCRHVVCRGGALAAVHARTGFVRHSCAPNAVCTARRDGAVVVRAVRAIARGAEITVSFLDEMQLLWPTRRRRECLLELRYAVCRCARCTRPDRTCAVRCPACRAAACCPTGLLLEPVPDELPPAQREERARRAATTPCWRCAACGAAYTAAQAPFCDEPAVLVGALQVEQRLEQRGPAAAGSSGSGSGSAGGSDSSAAFLADIERLRGECAARLGRQHWAHAQLTYARMIELQAQAVRTRDDTARAAVQRDAALAARDFFEWVDATLRDDCVALVANTGYVTAQMCQRCPDLVDYAAHVLARIQPLYVAAHGPDSPDARLIAESLKARPPSSTSGDGSTSSDGSSGDSSSL